jgi:hypothetical protein
MRTSENPAPIRSGARPLLRAAVRVLPGRQTAEKSDHYRDVIAVLSPGLRVVRCKCGIQWILQGRIGGQWRGVWYCRTKSALLRGAGQYAAHPALAALPDTIEPRRVQP